MRGIVAMLIIGLMAEPVLADTTVRGYVRKDGVIIRPHYRTDPNATPLDNYSTQGNINPYTGEPGEKVAPAAPDHRGFCAYAVSPADCLAAFGGPPVVDPDWRSGNPEYDRFWGKIQPDFSPSGRRER